MDSLLIIIPVTAAAFIATNTDNLILLVALLSRHAGHRAPVIAGYLAAMAILFGASFAIGRTAELIPETYLGYVGYLGIIPLLMGINGIIAALRPAQQDSSLPTPKLMLPGAVVATTMLTQLSNGVDTLLAFSTLFADSLTPVDTLVLVTAASMAMLFAVTAVYILEHQALGNWLKRASVYLTPLLLTGVGIFILLDTVTDKVPA
ncbi:MAG: cadmium resistance transporter [Chromatiales bacterium]|nr:cadmium resistance transporter [Chromatiales bacterium]